MSDPTIQQEVAWREASDKGHPMYDAKRRDIKALVDKMKTGQDKIKADHEDRFGDDLIELAGPVVRAGLENTTLGYGRRYAANFDKVFGDDK